MENDQVSQNAPAAENPVPEAQTQPEQPQPSSPMTAETPAPKPKSPNKLLLGLILILLPAFLGGAYFYFRNQSQNQKQTPDVQEPVPSVTQETPSPTPDPTADLKTYTTSTYQVKYPKDLLTREDDGSTFAISKWGPTQTEGTELFDGFAVTLQPRELPNITPGVYAETQIEEIEKQGVSEVTEGPTPITINNYNGVTYTEKGLGTYKQIILGSVDGIMLMQISVLVSDPGNLGFQETVDQILSTFEFVSGN